MSENNNILIIEDDQEISQLLQVILKKLGIHAVAAYSGTEGLLQLQRRSYDLILLDLMLPGKSGEELIQEIRERSTVPIIVISAKVDIENKVDVLKMGADDYITKPFNSKEVAARIEVQLRKSSTLSSQTRENTWRGLSINPDKHTVSLKNEILHVTNAEFDMLYLLISHPERAFSKREIYERIWQGTYLGDDNTISVHVSNLRKKMAGVTDDEYIKTVWGVGFMLI